MLPDGLLGNAWLAIATHLWQTTLVLLPLFMLVRMIKNAPARIVNTIWTLGLIKVLVPVSIIAPLARRTIVPLLGVLGISGSISRTASTWLGRAYTVFDPAILSASGNRPAGSGFGLPEVLTVAWLAGVVWFAIRICKRLRPSDRGLCALADAPHDVKTSVSRALAGTLVPFEQVYISSGTSMPSVIGLLRHRILVPRAMLGQLTSTELRAVLLHEDAHRRRRDPLRVLLQRCALLLFYYYPVLWLLLPRLASSCEIACDEAAVSNGIEPTAYAGALARTLSLGLLTSSATPALSNDSGSLIRRRFNRLHSHRRYVIMNRHRFALIAVVALVALVSLVPVPPFAETEIKSEIGGTTPDTPPPPDLKDDSTGIIPPPPPKTSDIDTPGAPPPPPPGVEGESLITRPTLVPESRVLPDYPEAARKAGLEARILLEVLIRKDGTVGRAEALEGALEFPSLVKSAVEAVGQWRFEPATKDGVPIETSVSIPIEFRLDSDKAEDRKE